MINVTKTFLPPFEEYTTMIKRAWNKSWITNNGELSVELEMKLKNYLDVRNVIFCNNGTIALQIALKAFNINGDVITTPFSYVASTTSILWENCNPVFVDINSINFCLDPSKIEPAITSKTQAILATHVYGYPCDIGAIQKIADKYNLHIIYDGAHAFGTRVNGKSVFNYGDISTCSFHATKLFHTGEGGCIITNSDKLAKQMTLFRQFGHVGDVHFSIGINGKNSELHAGMGLCNLRYIEEIMLIRKNQWLLYNSLLGTSDLQLLKIENDVQYNYAYFPVIFRSEVELLKAIETLKEQQIMARRYFYPALNTLPYVKYKYCPIAESVAKRVLCLPLFHDLTEEVQNQITNIISNL
jgi:dTDP-4-amino-4,6-dideoxygalactose transaminase